MTTKIAVVGAGPAGIYATDLILKTAAKAEQDVTVDLIERMPTPFGLIRYGVAPDHPRIKGIVTALHQVLDKPGVRFLGNIEISKDVTVAELQQHYDAVVFATGALHDRDLNIPGIDAEGSYGAAEFVGFYDGNPDFARTWDLSANQVAVIGVGNVGLDVARILAKTGEELHVTEIPDNVYETLKTNQATEVHVFGRRGPAQAKFTPQELKELDHSPTINVVVSPEDIDYDEASIAARRESKSQDLVCQILEQYAIREPKQAPHKLHIHLFEQPVEVLTENGKVVGLKTERTKLDGSGNVVGTGEYNTWPVQSVYRAVGYRSTPIPGLPFDEQRHVLPNDGAHILTEPDGKILPGLYTTGWIKRGPIGLIGNTKSDAKETIEQLFADLNSGKLAAVDHSQDVTDYAVARGKTVTTWQDWYQLDGVERQLGAAEGRERKKLVEWDELLAAAKGEIKVG